jgi:lipopolysaccharide export LptBFGC system permease protein LptF
MKRTVVNFIVLFTLFYLLGAVIDIIVNLDEFVKNASFAENDNIFTKVFSIIQVAFWYEAPRMFQVFGYLHGVIAIGAMAFTAASMLRLQEFVALMAAGISLRRVAAPFLVVTVGISMVALLNQEYMLPRVAPLLLRKHSESGSKSAHSFPIPFTPDQNRTLLLAASLDPEKETLTDPSFLERDEDGRMTRKIQATSATWNDSTDAGWDLHNGKATTIEFDEALGLTRGLPNSTIDYYETDLSPYLLTLHRYGQYVGMLGISQLNKMLKTSGSFNAPMLRRHWYARFSSILLNVLAMAIVIPLFVTKDAIVLTRQAILCGGIGLTILFGGSVLMLMPIADFPPLASVFLPPLILMPVALFRIMCIRT